MRNILFGFSLMAISFTSMAQNVMKLYPNGISDRIGTNNDETEKDGVVRKVSDPTLTIYRPPAGKANGTSVIVCPGGGYGVLVIDREGVRVAQEFAKIGVTAFVLKYRLPDSTQFTNFQYTPLQDAQQAIKMVREGSAKWGLDPAKIGIMGFSAGGHLAASAGAHFDQAFIENKSGTSLRPDFMILVYPVISFMDDIGHVGSRKNLLGNRQDTNRQKFFSNEFFVTVNTPPAFLTHASDDTVVPVAHSIRFYEALQSRKVNTEMHLYAKGEHGYLKVPSFEEWFGRCKLWLSGAKFLP